jgi:DNA polymerase-3 subunit alpha
MNSDELLKEECRNGFKTKVKPFLKDGEKQVYIDRIKYELEVICSLNFSDYFLIVQDIVRQARKDEVGVGPGRGSAAASLVLYCLDVTQLDPIKFGMLFERFLNKDRISSPDIDLDFATKGRGRVLEYIQKKYGKNRVAQVVTYSEMKGRGLIRDLAKCLNVDPIDIDKMSKLFGDQENTEGDLQTALENNEGLKKYTNKYPELFDIAINLMGCIRHVSKHAAGVVITKEPFLESLPVLTSRGNIQTQWDKKALEELNYLKMDILGLRNMDIIHDTLQLIGKDVLKDISIEDNEVFGEFSKGHTSGVFQFETWGMTKITKNVQPTKFMDLADICALVRPGASQGLEYYLKGRETGSIYYFGDERLKDIFASTHGTLLYQEQSIKICQAVAGFTVSEADIVRRGIGKKDKKDLEKVEKKFIDGCVKNGQKEEWARKLFDVIRQGERYSFNIPHATCYAMIAYQCMYLKTYYPVEFFTALLNNHIDAHWEKDGRLDRYERDVKRYGIKILDWDVNESDCLYKMDRENRTIRRGLGALLYVGDAAELIQKYRPYVNFQHFYNKVPKSVLKTETMKSLANAGSFNSLGASEDELAMWMSSSNPQKILKKFDQGKLFND